MADSVQPGSYGGLGALEQLLVILKNVDGSASINITSQVLNLSIYEDIFSPTVYGEVSIKDATNLLNGEVQQGADFGFPIVGEEYLEITYKVTGQEAVVRRFAIYSIKNISYDANLKARNYVLAFCSEEHLIDATTTVQKSWKNTAISDMVKDILEKYLKVNDTSPNGKGKKIYKIQRTRGPQDLIVPRLSPLEALKFFARRSIAEKMFTSGSYIFFENKDGFNFCDIEFLIQAGRQKRKANPEIYTYKHQNPRVGEDADGPDGDKAVNAYKTVMNLKQKHKFDTIEKLKRGYFENEVQSLNLTDRSMNNVLFKFIDKYKDFNAMGNPNSHESSGKNLVWPENSFDFIATVTENPPTAPKILGLFSLTKDLPESKHTKFFFIPKDGTKPDTFLEEIYTNRASYMTRLAQNMYTVDVYGDTAITAGDLITIEIPEIHGMTEKQEEDRFLSGYFLIASIHHKLTSDSYHCTFDLYKNGYSSPVVTTPGSPEPEPEDFLAKFTELDFITNAGT
jgi:hypothetical protein